jgi:hypothetical protein
MTHTNNIKQKTKLQRNLSKAIPCIRDSKAGKIKFYVHVYVWLKCENCDIKKQAQWCDYKFETKGYCYGRITSQLRKC